MDRVISQTVNLVKDAQRCHSLSVQKVIAGTCSAIIGKPY